MKRLAPGTGAATGQGNGHLRLREKLKKTRHRAGKADFDHQIGHAANVRFQSSQDCRRGGHPRSEELCHLLRLDRGAISPTGGLQAKNIALAVILDDPAFGKAAHYLAIRAESDESLGGGAQHDLTRGAGCVAQRIGQFVGAANNVDLNRSPIASPSAAAEQGQGHRQVHEEKGAQGASQHGKREPIGARKAVIQVLPSPTINANRQMQRLDYGPVGREG